MPTPFELFKEVLLEAAGDALARRGYALQDDAIQISGGLYRFEKGPALIDVQLLFYAGGGPSRFEIKVWRANEPGDKIRLGAWMREQNLETLADEQGWWEFVSAPELGAALRDATRGIEGVLNAE